MASVPDGLRLPLTSLTGRLGVEALHLLVLGPQLIIRVQVNYEINDCIAFILNGVNKRFKVKKIYRMGQGIQLIILAVFLVKNIDVFKVNFFCCFLFEGKYVYIETSSPRVTNDKAVLRFNGYTGGSACLSFYYHMFGDSIGQVNVYLGNRKVFQKSGSQGNQWKKAEMPINGQGDVRSYFFSALRICRIIKELIMCVK